MVCYFLVLMENHYKCYSQSEASFSVWINTLCMHIQEISIYCVSIIDVFILQHFLADGSKVTCSHKIMMLMYEG